MKNDTQDNANLLCRPLIKDWGLYFKKEDGVQNRLDIMEAFMEFWGDQRQDVLIVEGKCHLGGMVYGHREFHDGDGILTSRVMTMSREKRRSRRRASCDLIFVVTGSGSEYYIYGDDINPYMDNLVNDMFQYGKLSNESGSYIKENDLGLF